MNELLWITVPGGIGESGAVLRVVVIPRLTDVTLAAAGMEHWPPPALVNAGLAVDIGREVDVDVTTVNVPPPHVQAQPGLWDACFSNATVIGAGRPVARTDAVAVDRTSQHAETVKTTFGRCATIPIDDASSPALSDEVRQQLESNWIADVVPPAPPSTPPAPMNGPFDFHRTLSMLREHPAVLRALGLIFELTIPASALPPALQTPVVRVRWPQAPLPASLTITSPWTRVGREFLPASTASISSGMVTLTDDRVAENPADRRWDVVTVDVDAAVSRLHGAARELVSRRRPASPGLATETTALPALRTAGLLLLRRGRQEDFDARRIAVNRNATLDSMNDAVLTADDLALGYRIDVAEQGGDWFSLHRRTATYTLSEQTVVSARSEEEGHVKAHAAADYGAGVVRADEVVARWNGWSLSVPRPPFDGSLDGPRPAHLTPLPFRFDFQFAVVDRSLPRLRFSHQYQLRARVADLAGEGLRLSDAAADRCATALEFYRRYEPVGSPGLSFPGGPPAHLGPAESAAVVVIRSDGGSVAEFASQNPDYPVNPQRVLSPPRTTLDLAEQHGKLDGDVDGAFDIVHRALDGDTLVPDAVAGGICVFPRREPGGLLFSRPDRDWTEPWPDLLPKHLELREPQGDTGSAAEWKEVRGRGDVLFVGLAKAEQVTFEISTFLAADVLDHFAIKEHLPTASESLVQQGRHPMVTPASVVTLVHAVRKPLNDPRGSLAAARAPGETFAILHPEIEMFGVHANSTAQIDVTASWPERHDDQPPRLTTTAVQTVMVHRGDTALQETLRHEFGDTRHRAVTYTVTAVSRFRQFFKADEPEAAFLAPATLRPIMILNSARPAPPSIVSTRPAFVWSEGNETDGSLTVLRRHRHGGHLRIELERPWFQTGDGERLAVIVSTDGRPPAEVTSFMSEIGSDPIWATPSPPRWPTAEMFNLGADAVGDALVEEGGQVVDLTAHDVWFHNDRWYADVVLSSVAATSYCPMVRLAIARYQPQSIVADRGGFPAVDLRLSRIVKTDFVPLLPERTLTVKRSGGHLVVSLSGLGPVGPSLNRVDVVLEQAMLADGQGPEAIALTAFTEAPGGPPAWHPVPGQIRQGGLNEEMAIDLPVSAGAFRLRVREVERIAPEGTVVDPQTTTVGELTERAVFADVVVLDLES